MGSRKLGDICEKELGFKPWETSQEGQEREYGCGTGRASWTRTTELDSQAQSYFTPTPSTGGVMLPVFNCGGKKPQNVFKLS